jgi:sporulation protein YlmC with PRC-barrel domain|tara:strand:+ start:866 stop:1207 length:342 start_codon:yes stop_codon:yes gene_type:complete
MAVCNLTELVGKDVFTRNAKFVGKIDDTMLDTEKGNLYGVAVGLSKDSFLSKAIAGSEAGARKSILIPYKEIIAADDIILVTVPKQYERPEDVQTPPDEMDEVILPGVGEEGI